jgi:hypothetical protein
MEKEMARETYRADIPEDVKSEMAFLHSLGIAADELDYLITAKMRRSLG